MPHELNARIGRTLPSPLLAMPAAGTASAPSGATLRPLRGARPWWLLAGLVAALWPHWAYVARRMVDGSDEPWGIVALATVIALLLRDRAALTTPTRSALVASGALALAAALASVVLPDLAAAALAMLALATFLVHALRRPASPLLVLLLLALPVIASLQFYLGYPLRALTAQASALALALAGIDVSAAGASLLHQGTTVLVDAPCAGIGMLWVGSYTAALLSYLNRAGAWRTASNGLAAGLLVLAANVARNSALFFPEAGLTHWPAWAHEAIGLGAFALAIVPLVLITARTAR